jgi:hypothetical protein
VVAVVATALTMAEIDNNQQKAAAGASKTVVMAAAKAEQWRLW